MLPHRKFKLSSLISIIYYNYFSQYGYPINQEDLAGTLSTFSSVVLRGLELLGVMATDSEKYGYQQLWKFVGYYLGQYQSLFYYRIYSTISRDLDCILCFFILARLIRKYFSIQQSLHVPEKFFFQKLSAISRDPLQSPNFNSLQF